LEDVKIVLIIGRIIVMCWDEVIRRIYCVGKLRILSLLKHRFHSPLITIITQ